MKIKGKIVPGHGIASGKAQNTPYPGGSINLQIPFFRTGGLDLGNFYPGTLNLSIAPLKWEPGIPDFVFEQVKWIENHQPENFSFFSCKVLLDSRKVESWIYYPHPETKTTHFQTNSILEIVSHPLKVKYGDPLIHWKLKLIQIRSFYSIHTKDLCTYLPSPI